MDADDICEPARLERQIELLQSDAEIRVCGSWVLDIDRDGHEIEVHAMPIGARLQTFWWRPSPLQHPSVMWRAQKQRSFYDENLEYAQDYDLWLKLGLRGEKFRNIAQTLLRYRVHSESISGRHRAPARANSRILQSPDRSGAG